MYTINETQLSVKDKSILKIVNETPDGIRQIELSRRASLSVNALRWHIMGLAARGLLEIVTSQNKVTIYPVKTEAAQ
jgi:predicted transcriptional regulator